MVNQTQSLKKANKSVQIFIYVPFNHFLLCLLFPCDMKMEIGKCDELPIQHCKFGIEDNKEHIWN